MHVGYAGLLQNFADGLKLFRKNTYRPRDADTLGFYSGPSAYMVTSIIIFAILPISTGWTPASLPLSLLLALADLLVRPAYSSSSARGPRTTSTSLMGGMRSAAQMIAYEVPILLAVVAVVIVSRELRPQRIVEEQQNYWFWGPLFLALIVFVAGMLAEMERIPFDLPEAEAELVEGWNTEYGGMLFAFFMLADYLRALVGSILVVLLFLGGWTLPTYVPAALTSFPLAGIFWFMLKTYARVRHLRLDPRLPAACPDRPAPADRLDADDPAIAARGLPRRAWSSWRIASPCSAASPRLEGRNRTMATSAATGETERQPGPVGHAAAGHRGAPVREAVSSAPRRSSTRSSGSKTRSSGGRSVSPVGQADRRRRGLGQLSGRPRAEHRDLHLAATSARSPARTSASTW